MTTPLFNARTTDGQSGVFHSEGRFATVLASGDFDGAVIAVEASPDGGITWIGTDVNLTTDAVKNFISGKGVTYRLNLSGAGAATNVNAWCAFER